jgi:hypothetical protein
MAKGKILTPNGGLALPESCANVVEHSRVPKIVDVKPTGSQVLVEILTAQELANTNITISEKTDLKVPLQGYIRAVGPGFKSVDWGFDVGNRVLISGGGVIAPTYDDTHRDRFFMEPTAIKSVLIEE